ncbi:MAG: hypothetical protein WDA22_17465 [Bacteroidota bacterium]
MQFQSVGSNVLPTTISQMISEKYKKWELVVYSYTKLNKEKVVTKFIRGDFNGDSILDYAVMIKVNNDPQNCRCLAFVSQSQKYLTFTIGGKYSVSRSSMQFDRKGSRKYDYNTQSEIVLTSDAFTIATEGCNTYVFKKNSFVTLASCD